MNHIQPIKNKFVYDVNSPSYLRCIDTNYTIYLNSMGYYETKIHNARYKAHRIIYAIFHENFDEDNYIDHIDGNTKNNNILNLREVTHKINMKNKKKYKNNISGVGGITFRKIKGIDYIRAYIRIDGILTEKYFNISKYESFDLAMDEAKEYRSSILTKDFTGRHGND